MLQIITSTEISVIVMTREIGIAIASFPGFKFSPTEEELILYYLKRKIQGFQNCVEAIAEIDITCYEPWDLPEKSVFRSNDEWFFFSNRGRKYPKGLQSKRATQLGYWKATGKERNVKSGTCVIGTKRTLVFHKGRAPKGKRTEWIMHEYCLSGTPQESFVVCRLRKASGLDCDDNPPKELNQSTGESSASTLLNDRQQENVFDRNIDNNVENEDIFRRLTPPDRCNNPYSVDGDESESEYDKKPLNPNCQVESCSSPKEYEGDEDDCFADIVNDDIIKLDGSSLSSSTDILGNDILNDDFIDFKFEQPTEISPPAELPFQGTANRRIRLNMLRKSKTKTIVPLKASCIEDEMCCIVAESAQLPHYLITTLMFDVAVNHSHILVFVVLLLCLWLLIWHDFRNDKLRRLFNGLEDLGYGSM